MNFKQLLFAVILMSGLISGCSSIKEELKPVELKPIAAKYLLLEKWQRQTGAGQDARYTRLQPALLNGVIYVADVKGGISAWDAKTGRQKWKRSLGLSISGGFGVVEGLGFLGSLGGEVIAINLADGSQKWKAKASSEVVTAPQANDDVVIAQAIDGRVFAFDIKDGHQRWTYDHPMPVLSLRSNSAPLVSGGDVFLGFDNGQLLSFNGADGLLRWSARLGQPKGKTELDRLVDVDAAPIEMGPYVYGAGYNSRLVAINKGNGRVAWGQNISTSQNIAAGKDFIAVSDANSHMAAFNALDGSILWENKDLHRRGLSAPVVLDGVVIAVDGNGYIHGFAAADGTLIARFRGSSNAVFAQPLAFENTLYFLDKKGLLMAYELKPHDGPITIWDMPTRRKAGAIPTKSTGVN